MCIENNVKIDEIKIVIMYDSDVISSMIVGNDCKFDKINSDFCIDLNIGIIKHHNIKSLFRRFLHNFRIYNSYYYDRYSIYATKKQESWNWCIDRFNSREKTKETLNIEYDLTKINGDIAEFGKIIYNLFEIESIKKKILGGNNVQHNKQELVTKTETEEDIIELTEHLDNNIAAPAY